VRPEILAEMTRPMIGHRSSEFKELFKRINTGLKALFVGDMPIDIRAARNSGVDVAVVTTGSSSREELVAAKPDHVLERFADLVKIVRKEAA
jgi:phosphoglycolate phosphatase-like HAD superfamily hydrolase